MRNEDVAANELLGSSSRDLSFSAPEAASGEAFAFEKNGEMVAKASCEMVRISFWAFARGKGTGWKCSLSTLQR